MPQNTFIGSKYLENQVWQFEKFEKYLEDAQKISVHNGPSTFPNELTRFPFEAKPIWEKIQKHCNYPSVTLTRILFTTWVGIPR